MKIYVCGGKNVVDEKEYEDGTREGHEIDVVAVRERYKINVHICTKWEDVFWWVSPCSFINNNGENQGCPSRTCSSHH